MRPRPSAGSIPVFLLAALAAGCHVGPPPDTLSDGAPDFTFGVMGDVPYSGRTEALFPRLVASLEAAAPAFVVHVGDIKAGSAPCTDSLLADRKAALAAIDLPLIYLPGDNEWADCHRSGAGAHDPLERLGALREIFYGEGGGSTVGGRPWPLERQSAAPAWAEFVEHQRWRYREAIFVTLHVVGSLNGLAPFDARTATHDAEVDRRIDASVAWLRNTFRAARAQGAPVVVVAIHGNPWLSNRGRSGVEEILASLAEEARAFARPVLLVHGDSHTFRMDQPLADSLGPVTNLTRLETYGDPDVGWVEVGVDLDGDPAFLVAGRRVE